MTMASKTKIFVLNKKRHRDRLFSFYEQNIFDNAYNELTLMTHLEDL